MRVEAIRQWIENSGIWAMLVWLVVMFFKTLEQVLGAGGMEKWAQEVKKIRGFWQEAGVPAKRKTQ